MVTYEKRIFINRPQQEVWDYFSNPANNSQWRSGTESAEWTSGGPPGVGSTQRWVSKMLGRKIESTSEITAWDPPNEVGYKSVGGPLLAEGTWKLEPKENGTQLNVRGQVETGGFLKMAEGLVGKQGEKQLDASLEALKQVLEAGQG